MTNDVKVSAAKIYAEYMKEYEGHKKQLQALKFPSNASYMEISIQHAKILRAASKSLREISLSHRKIAEETRKAGRVILAKSAA